MFWLKARLTYPQSSEKSHDIQRRLKGPTVSALETQVHTHHHDDTLSSARGPYVKNDHVLSLLTLPVQVSSLRIVLCAQEVSVFRTYNNIIL